MNATSTRLWVQLLAPCLVVILPVTVASANPDSSQALRATKVVVQCKPGTVNPNKTTECTLSVSDISSGTKVAPTGTVAVASNGPGSFDVPSCTLVPAVTASKCVVRYTPTQLGTGTHVITATYSGSNIHAASSKSVEVGVAPPNDTLRGAEPLAPPPSSASGTVVGATATYSEPDADCASMDGTVWYRYVGRRSERVAVLLKAHGKLDAALAVFQQVRSQYKALGCATTDEKGEAGLAFETQKRGRYLLVVGAREGSARSTFRLELFAPPVARPPGAILPRGGARSAVDPLRRPEEAWSSGFIAGRTYRINLAPDEGRCLSLSLYAPRTKSFADSSPIKHAHCGGYLVFTPGPDGGGRYSLLIEAESGRRGAQVYRLNAALVGPDDTAPGITVGNHEKRTGSLSGRGIDVVDLYRFEVSHLSDVTLRYQGSRGLRFDLLLLSSKGGRIECACDETGGGKLRMELKEGEYFFAFRAVGQSVGRYSVSLLIREITTTTATIDGLPEAYSTPGRSVTLGALVTPTAASGGPVRLQIDRFDPIEGWQFVRLFSTRVGAGGQASVRWTPLALGRWRLHASFLGSSGASPSKSGYAYLVVAPQPRP